mmetsp:Transcript_37834/g.68418  ORF Transcript_37834/g.68418 Transcript_37834/m.68418 type:complete len:217 (-) Transcript_37834:933-1583(-)
MRIFLWFLASTSLASSSFVASVSNTTTSSSPRPNETVNSSSSSCAFLSCFSTSFCSVAAPPSGSSSFCPVLCLRFFFPAFLVFGGSASAEASTVTSRFGSCFFRLLLAAPSSATDADCLASGTSCSSRSSGPSSEALPSSSEASKRWNASAAPSASASSMKSPPSAARCLAEAVAWLLCNILHKRWTSCFPVTKTRIVPGGSFECISKTDLCAALM